MGFFHGLPGPPPRVGGWESLVVRHDCTLKGPKHEIFESRFFT
jgi:hypothetical protein